MELKYSLAELPSSQHRAGLAGLVLVLEHLKAKEKTKAGVLELKELGPRGATLEMTKEGLGIIFDEIYAASVEEVAREQPFKDKKGNLSPYLRTEEREKVAKNGKVTRKTFWSFRESSGRSA